MRISETLKIAGKYIDQPLLINKIHKAAPYGLCGLGAGYVGYDTYHSPEDNRKTNFVKSSMIMAGTIGSALMAPKIATKIFRNGEKRLTKTDIIKQNTTLIDEWLKHGKSEKAGENKQKEIKILHKAKSKLLNYSDIKYLNNRGKTDKNAKQLLNSLIPEPEAPTAKDIFSEVGWLSVLGFIPVVGGVASGCAADALTEKHWKNNVPNKVKEGAYQFLANIFLCNIGACAALKALESMRIQSKSARVAGMTGGIIGTGVIGGNAIANYLGKKLIDPCFKNTTTSPPQSGRHPEALDIGLHTDDVATISVMSGLKWIEPVLPIFYTISGYRAGIGYRNEGEPQ